MQIRLVFLGGILAIATISGCASRPSHDAAGALASASVTPRSASASTSGAQAARLATDPLEDPTADRTIVYAAGLTSSPTAGVRASRVTGSRAIELVDAAGKVSEALQPGTPNRTLRSVSIGYSRAEAGFAPHLAWVLTWDHSEPPHGRGPIGQDQSKADRKISKLRCVFVTIVNASTGKLEDNRQFCRGQ